MKPSHLRILIMLAIVAIVLFGNSNINKNLGANLSDMAISHASLWAPEVDLVNMDCQENGIPNKLLVPKPDKFYLQDYEEELYGFIMRREYDTDLKWCVDKRVRDTGPWIKGTYYGIHPGVRIYYSPRMMYWLTGDPSYWKNKSAVKKDPREGPVPEGAMIVKEMFWPPADLSLELKELITQCEYGDDSTYEELLSQLVMGWAVMVKAGPESKDGWFWAGPGAPGFDKKGVKTPIDTSINNQLDRYNHIQYSGFGQPSCLRCHSSAEKEFTFSDLKNIQADSTPPCDTCAEDNLLAFRIDDSWRDSSYINTITLGRLIHFREKLKDPKLKMLIDSCFTDSLFERLFYLPAQLRPWTDKNVPGWEDFMHAHTHPSYASDEEVDVKRFPSINPAFVATFPQITGNSVDLKRFPSQWADHVIPGASKVDPYITSDNCLGCHGGLGGDPYDVAMFIKTGPKYGDGYNVSEYGEWRWSPMGLAGRDPIFFAQLESEMAILKKDEKQGGLLHGSLKDNQEQITSTCLSCHGAMGQRQLKLDARKEGSDLDSLFKVEYVYLTEALSAEAAKKQDSIAKKYHKYGELAREGISCTVCHHINQPDPKDVNQWNPNPGHNWLPPKYRKEQKELAYMLYNNTTGQFVRGPADELNGPFDDVRVKPMEKVLGITPKQDLFIQNSQLCGTCHTINLPNIGLDEARFPVLDSAEQNPAFKEYNHTIEQATFLEWQNSSFGQFAKPGEFQSCQDCHMPGGFQSLDGSINIPQVTTKIATIQDDSYPEVDNEEAHKEIQVPFRADYKRHEHVGLNVFLLEMFNQFPEVLGVDKSDYMTSATSGNSLAIENMIRQARKATIDLDFEVKSMKGQKLEVEVTVKNKTGHRFPSGVSFRRAFIEFLVLEGDDVIWGSGRTNSVGVIVGKNGRPLKTEFLNVKSGDSILYQPHHQVITSQDQVQIYEELNQNKDRHFTTSFIHRVHPKKDNRLLPRGWRPSSYFKDKKEGEIIFQFMEATDPEFVGSDPNYKGVKPPEVFKGQDQLKYDIELPKDVDPTNLSIKVTVLNQSIPPYFLNQRFTLAPEGKATQRLFYLTSHLNLEGTPMKNWKLPLVSKHLAYCEDTGIWEEAMMMEEECK